MAGWRKAREPKVIVRNTNKDKYLAEIERKIKFGYAIEKEVQEEVLLKSHRNETRKTYAERTAQRNLNHRKRTYADGIEYIAIMVDTQKQQQIV